MPSRSGWHFFSLKTSGLALFAALRLLRLRFWFRFWLRLGSRGRRRSHRESLKERGAIRTAPTTARVPTFGGFIVTVITRRDVPKRPRHGGNALIQVRIQVADGLANGLVEERKQSGPQRSDGAGSSDGETRAVHLHLVAGRGVGIAGNVGKATTLEVTRIVRGRNLGTSLPGRDGEGGAYSAAGGPAVGKIVPNHFLRNRTAAEGQCRAAAG